MRPSTASRHTWSRHRHKSRNLPSKNRLLESIVSSRPSTGSANNPIRVRRLATSAMSRATSAAI